MIPVTVGICAYNEAANIEATIRSLYSQRQMCFTIDKAVVVSSGSTDRTDDIVKGLQNEFRTLELIRQEKRMGKNSAINLVLDEDQAGVVVLLNADNTLASEDSLDNLVRPLEDPQVGMVGGHPVPTNGTDSMSGFMSNLIWSMHHHISEISPKIGELMAFRNVGGRLPTDMQSDEDILRMNLEKAGYRSVYVPEATVSNRGPETIHDFMKQRVRVNIGEMYMKRTFSYKIPTHDYKKLYAAMLGSIRDMGWHPFKMIFAVLMELSARAYASAYVKADKGDMNVWAQVQSTKKL